MHTSRTMEHIINTHTAHNGRTYVRMSHTHTPTYTHTYGTCYTSHMPHSHNINMLFNRATLYDKNTNQIKSKPSNLKTKLN